MYISVTLNSGDVFGCFALMRYEPLQDVCCGLMCFYRNCCTAMHKPRTIIQFQFLIFRMTGLKTNGTYYNRTIIHIDE